MKKIDGSDARSSTPMPMSGDRLSDPCSDDEISLYVHLPFCKYQCPYCHFYVVKNSPEEHAPFIDRLIAEDLLYKPYYEGKTVRSIYFGGGTPSLVEANLLERLLQALSRDKQLSGDLEITLEANPETVTPLALERWQTIGINRLSLGVQSLERVELQALGRGHLPSTAQSAIEAVSKAGFRSFSLDLMMEIPHQTPLSWDQTLELMARYRPPHLSLYNLVIEPGTPFARREKQIKKQIVNEEVATSMLAHAIERLSQIGLERYEISAFAQKGHESCHNSGYWRSRAFVGLGPSAFSFLGYARLQNVASLTRWSQSIDQQEKATELVDHLSQQARVAELLAIHLRLSEGVNLESFIRRHGQLPQLLQESIEALLQKGWLEKAQGCLRLTPQGQLFYERVASELILLDDEL